MKALLLIDMPDKCFKCPVVDMTLHLCHMTGKAIYPELKPDTCPIKPLPQKKKTEYWCSDGKRGRQRRVMADNVGYNRCIDEIVGGMKDV